MKLKPKANVLDRLAAKRQDQTAARLVRVIPPYLCLVDLKSQRGTEHDWTTVLFRIAYGVQLAREFFESQEATFELHRALTTLTQIHSTAPGRAKLWYVTSRESEILGPALALTDELEDLCTPREIRAAYNAACAYLG